LQRQTKQPSTQEDLLLRILFFGDIVGKAGRDVVRERIGALRESVGADVVIANGENAAGGAGITAQMCRDLFELGVDVITLGNHAWDKREIATYIEGEPRLIRPLNFPAGTPGCGYHVVTRGGQPLCAVVQAHGRVYTPLLLDDPFRRLEEVVAQLRSITPVIVVDFHAEATAEKVALGWFLDGKVSAVIGTHTHVQTADEAILPGGTAYLTDVGMCGPWQSVIGSEVGLVLQRFLTQMPVRFEVAEGPAVLSAVVLEVDETTGRAVAIRRLLERQTEN
jgi:2',3'-cyclic-nucleotide 2'-phosphodiesterase